MSFDALKKNRSKVIEDLQKKAAESAATKKNYTDDRFWAPTVDKAGNGYALIRFLPAPDGETTPWVRYWDHGFQGPTGRWYIENSRTTIGEPDYISEYNSKLWNSGNEKDKELARKQKRRLHYVTNILVLSDSANPENEGKVFLFKFGKKIFDKILDKMQPQFPDEKPVNPFDFWEGANFKLKIRNVEGYRNYDKSEFDSVSELFDGDEDRLKEVYENLNSLQDFVDPKNFKSYEELKRKAMAVLGEGSDEDIGEERASSYDDDGADDDADVTEERESPVKENGDGSETLSYFAQLAAKK
jgi:hypothetical protein